MTIQTIFDDQGKVPESSDEGKMATPTSLQYNQIPEETLSKPRGRKYFYTGIMGRFLLGSEIIGSLASAGYYAIFVLICRLVNYPLYGLNTKQDLETGLLLGGLYGVGTGLVIGLLGLIIAGFTIVPKNYKRNLILTIILVSTSYILVMGITTGSSRGLLWLSYDVIQPIIKTGLLVWLGSVTAGWYIRQSEKKAGKIRV